MKLENKSINISEPANTSTQAVFEAIAKKVEAVNDLKELSEVFNLIKSLNLKFKSETLTTNYIIIFILSFILFWLIFIILLSQLSFESLDIVKYYFFFFFGCVIFGILYGGWLSQKVSYTQYISDFIILKKVILDNNLCDESYTKEWLNFFEDKFFIFQQGDYSRDFIKFIKGEHNNNFVYHYFHFNYVDKRTSTSTDANGKESSSTTYYHYDLYGITIPFSLKNCIKISNYDKTVTFEKLIRWNTSSISFNNKFEVFTDNEQAISKFLQPKVIEQIEHLYETFPKLDLEISSDGLLAFSTPDQELLNHSRKYGVDQLDLFKEEITKTLNQTKLHKALEFIQFLKEYCEPT